MVQYNRNIISRLVLLFVAVLVGLTICEVALRFFYIYRSKDNFYVHPPNERIIFNPIPGIMPGISRTSEFYINSQGIRGDEFTNDQQYRILTLGGSTTECLYLDTTEAWPCLVQKRLNSLKICKVWVGNTGASGKTTKDIIAHMKYLLPKYPKIDLIIVLTGINDFQLRLLKGAHYDLDRRESEQERIRSAFWIYPFYCFKKEPQFYKNTAFWDLGRRIKRLVSSKPQDVSGEYYVEVRKKRKNASEILNNLPDLTSALEEYGRDINTIINMANKNSIRVIFLTQPFMWRPDLTVAEKDMCWAGKSEVDTKYYSLSALSTGLTQYNNKLSEVCKSRKIEFIDLANCLTKDATVFYDDMHFNKNGCVMVAETIFNYLRQKEPFVKGKT